MAHTLNTPADLLGLLRWSRVVAFDLETTGLNPRRDRIRLLSVSDGNRSLVLDCFEHDVRQILPALNGKVLVAHNAAFDLGFLWNAGMTDLPETVCTYLVGQLLTAGEGGGDESRGFPPLNLDACCRRWLGRELPKELQASDWSGPLSIAQVEYSRNDAAVLLPLFRSQQKDLEKAGLVRCSDLELRALPAFVWMGQQGVPFDRQGWLDLAAMADKEKAALGSELERRCPSRGAPGLFGAVKYWNWDSPKQVADVLGRLGFRVDTTNDAQLSLIDHPVAELLRQHRHQSQLVKMYGQHWLDGADIERERVYPGWRQLGAASGRTSCKAPNFQQIPRDPGYRACVQAPPGRVLVKADYSTLQMRIAAKWAKDGALYKIFKANGDPHTATAQALLGKKNVSKADRQIAKSANFGLLFGMSAAGLQVYARMTYGVAFTTEEATKHRETFFKTYPGLARWHQETSRGGAKETRTASGRRRLLPPHAPNTWRLNSPVQGDEADGLKLALALLWERRARCPEAFPVLAVHDEIVVETPKDGANAAKEWLESALLDGMSPWVDPIPCQVESGILKSWGET